VVWPRVVACSRCAAAHTQLKLYPVHDTQAQSEHACASAAAASQQYSAHCTGSAACCAAAIAAAAAAVYCCPSHSSALPRPTPTSQQQQQRRSADTAGVEGGHRSSPALAHDAAGYHSGQVPGDLRQGTALRCHSQASQLPGMQRANAFMESWLESQSPMRHALAGSAQRLPACCC
jgi:hypothetical protein